MRVAAGVVVGGILIPVVLIAWGYHRLRVELGV